MKINAITNINFKNTDNNTNNTINSNIEYSTQKAIMMLRDPSALVQFQKNRDLALKADSLETNPITSLGYKLYRTFNLLKDEQDIKVENKELNLIA